MNVIQMPTGSRRRNRSPAVDFHLRHRAYVIQPFMFHPVRSGETLKSLMFQARAVTDPIANPLMGWHLEYYFFYCQLQDLVSPGTEDTALAPLWDWSKTFADAGSIGAVQTRLEMYSVGGNGYGADLTYNAYRRVIEEYFRDEGETWNSAHKMSGALALARRNRNDFAESLGFSPTTHDATINTADGLTASEIVGALSTYAMNYAAGVGEVTTFEDFLASQGMGKYSDVKRAYRPELLRFMKEWTYPVNTVDPLTGTPSSAVSWAISGRADKDRFFKEPGMIVGLTLARPKTLTRNPWDPVQGLMKGHQWLPKQSLWEPTAGLVVVPSSGGVSYDSRDLFEHGSQFVNFDLAGTYKANQLQWVPASGSGANNLGVYPVESSINSTIWKDPTKNNCRQDGRVDLTILTDLPKDFNQGSDSQEPAAAEADVPRSVAEVAEEYVAKLRERRAGARVNLPDIRGMIEKGLLAQ